MATKQLQGFFLFHVALWEFHCTYVRLMNSAVETHMHNVHKMSNFNCFHHGNHCSIHTYILIHHSKSYQKEAKDNHKTILLSKKKTFKNVRSDIFNSRQALSFLVFHLRLYFLPFAISCACQSGIYKFSHQYRRGNILNISPWKLPLGKTTAS